MKVIVIGEASEVTLALEFQRVIEEQLAQGRLLHSWNMTQERFVDGVSERIIVAVFQKEWKP